MLLLSGLALAADPASAQQWTVTVDPLTTALGFVHVQVERALGPRVSVYAGPSLRLFDSVLGFPPGSFRGYGGEVGVRGFVWGTAPRGAWVMARGVLADVVSDGRGELGGYTSLLVGFTGIVGPGLVLSGGLGVSYFDYGSDLDGGGVHGVLPAAHTNIGWAF
jgi:hypothetical protein